MMSSDRAHFLGGSDAAAVLGLSAYRTPLELWRQKTGRAEPPRPDPVRERMFARGRKLEPYIRDMVIDKLCALGHRVELLASNRRYSDAEHPFLSAEIDFELRLDGEHVNADAKSVVGFARRKWGDEDSEDVPIEYAAQFMHGLMVTGRRRCLVGALKSFDDVELYWTLRDEATVAAMRGKLVRFWLEHVVPDVPPDPLDYDDVSALYPLDNGAAVEASAEVAAQVLVLQGVRAQLADLARSEALLKTSIAAAMSPHARLVFEGRDIATWKAQQSVRLDQGALKAAHPELVERFMCASTVRVLRCLKARHASTQETTPWSTR